MIKFVFYKNKGQVLDNTVLGFFLGHLTFMLGLYLIADEIPYPKISQNIRFISLSSLICGGFGLMILSIHKM